MMKRFLVKQYNKIREKVHSFSLDVSVPIERLGSQYGGWVFPEGLLSESSVCYFAGAGTDISFDIDVAQNYGAQIFIFDPTPGAIAHYQETKEGVLRGEKMFTQGNKYQYPDAPKAFEQIQFMEYGLWNKDDVLKFYVPANENHISHSVKNLNKTSDYFDAKVKKLSSVMLELGHSHIDLLKIDIEGAEYEVLHDIVDNHISIDAICVEFDENFMKNMDSNYLQRISETVEKLRKVGYKLIHIEKPFDMSFVHERKLDKKS